MRIEGLICLLLLICSAVYFYKRFFDKFDSRVFPNEQVFVLQFSDSGKFECGLLVFGCFRQLFNALCLLLLYRLGLKFLQFGFGYHFKFLPQFLFEFRGKSSGIGNGSCSLKHCKWEILNNLDLNPPGIENLEETQDISDGPECCEEDEEVDVMALRKLVKMERGKSKAANLEVEKERTAAATAASEAMAMILRLQNEKSLIEMEANQDRRLAEEKQLHDQEVIQSLRWLVMKHESERSFLEDQLRFLKRKLKIRDDEEEASDESLSYLHSNIEGSASDSLASSLEIDLLSPLRS
ncbi:hypothetical protein NMG60_11021368 [Bertholletia excelsa]